MARTTLNSLATLFAMMFIALGSGCAAEVDGTEPLDSAPYDEELDEGAPYDDELDESEVLTESITYPNCTVTQGPTYLGIGTVYISRPDGSRYSSSAHKYEARATGSGCANACAAWTNALKQLPAYSGYSSGYSWRSPVCTAYLFR